MFEPTKASLVREFVTLARAAKTDAEKLACQDFARDTFLPQNTERETRHGALIVFLGAVASHFDQASFQAPQNFDMIMRRIPEQEKGVRYIGRKLAVNEGLIAAPGWA